jgi:hypothetical protein
VKKPKPKLVAIEKGAFPREQNVPGAIQAKFADGTPVDVVGEIAFGVKPKSLAQETLLLVGGREVKLPKGFYVALAVDPDAKRCVVVEQQKGEMFEVDLASRKATKVFSIGTFVPRATSWLDGDHVVLLVDDALFLLSRDAKSMRATDPLAIDGLTLATASGRIVVASRKNVQVVDVVDGSLRVAAKLAGAPIAIAHEGGVFLTDHRFPEKRTKWWKLEGLA